jgi:hypothetical protein
MLKQPRGTEERCAHALGALTRPAPSRRSRRPPFLRTIARAPFPPSQYSPTLKPTRLPKDLCVRLLQGHARSRKRAFDKPENGGCSIWYGLLWRDAARVNT